MQHVPWIGWRRLRRHQLVLCVSAFAFCLVAAGVASPARSSEARNLDASRSDRNITVALITDTGGLNDRSFNQLAFEGLMRAKRRLGIKTMVLTSKSSADYIPNLVAAARRDADVVIAVGFLLADSVNTVAQRFPDTKFAIVDVSISTLEDKPKNVGGYVFNDKESGYLAGYLAGLIVKAGIRGTGSKGAVGSVGGVKIPPVDNYISGFNAGATAAYPRIKTFYGYSQDFADPAKCKELALNQIARGASVIFSVAGGCGLGALTAAKDEHVWGVMSGADLNYLGDHMLGSALKRTGVVVTNIAALATAGKLVTGRDKVYNVKSGGVGLGPINPSVPAKIKKKVHLVEKRFVRGLVPKIPDLP